MLLSYKIAAKRGLFQYRTHVRGVKPGRDSKCLCKSRLAGLCHVGTYGVGDPTPKPAGQSEMDYGFCQAKIAWWGSW